MMSVIDTKKIAGNTLMLYLRMGLILLISLYTSRVILDSLGEVDFGIYNSVGGIVAMFAFLSGTLATSCQRFFMVELGKDDTEQLRKVFSICLLAFLCLAGIIVVVTEPAGLWFLLHKMKLEGRAEAAQWVFHCSILSCFASMVSLPFQGMVIAREKMKVFAYISVFEALGALGIALLLTRSGGDHLKLYAVLMLLMQCLVASCYILYCRRFFPECRFVRVRDRSLFKEIFSFTGWNVIGTAAGIFKVHGLNLLLNMFYGPAVNAARGMAMKVFGMVSQLRENFMVASKPQIIKAYSSGEHDGMKKLVFQSAKFSTYLMLLLAIPFLAEMSFLLDIWLKDVPEYTAIFATLLLVNALLEGADLPVIMAIQANGNIKWYQIVVGSIQLLILPVTYLFLKFGTFPPQIVFYLSIAISVLAFFARMYFARKLAGISIPDITVHALIPMLVVTLVPLAAALGVRHLMPEGWLRLICVTLTSTVLLGLTAWGLGMTRSERETVLRFVRKTLSRP